MEIQNLMFKITILIGLSFGALGPIFRQDQITKYIGAVCVAFLTIYSGIKIIKSHSWQDSE
jgi:hypothetical protein